MIRVWALTRTLLSDYYPPKLFVFLPLYKLFRRRCKLPMPISNFFVWLISAVLHGGLFLLTGSIGTAVAFFAVFLFLGCLSTLAVVLGKRRVTGVLRSVRQN